MAALHKSPLTFRAHFPIQIRAKSLNPKPFFSSFPATFPSINLTGKSAGKTRTVRHHRGGATMMDTAASRYAAALADVAKSNGSLESTSVDMEKVEKIFSDELIYKFFTNPTVEIENKRNLIDEIARSLNLQLHTSNFLKILIDTKRIDLINEIVKEFEVFYNKITNMEMAIVASVVRLESQHLAQIAKGVQRLTGAKNVRIKTVMDPSLVAGFTIRYGPSGSKLIDMSVKKRLDEISRGLDFSDLDGIGSLGS